MRCSGVEVPRACPGVPAELLQPRSTWADADAYDRTARRLAAMFAENFAAYADGVPPDVAAAGPRATTVAADGARIKLAGPGEG